VTFDLERFRAAQDAHGAYDDAMAELRAGQKASHWIWFVFPQLDGLGNSPMARRFGLRGRAEAAAYLADPVLRDRLLAATEAVHAHVVGGGARVERVMGSGIDALKLVSSLTLFERVAAEAGAGGRDTALGRLAALATEVLDAAEGQGLPRCVFTLGRI